MNASDLPRNFRRSCPARDAHRTRREIDRAEAKRSRETVARMAPAPAPQGIAWREVPLYRLDSGRELSAAERIEALTEYRATGGITGVTMALPADGSPEAIEAACSSGPELGEINWAGWHAARFEAWLAREQFHFAIVPTAERMLRSPSSLSPAQRRWLQAFVAEVST